jgi:hypothetical protein
MGDNLLHQVRAQGEQALKIGCAAIGVAPATIDLLQVMA